MASSLLKYSLFDHGLPELTAASEKICLLHDYLEGTGEAWKCFFLICAQQSRNLYIMNLSLIPCIWLNFLFCCIEVCCVCPGS